MRTRSSTSRPDHSSESEDGHHHQPHKRSANESFFAIQAILREAQTDAQEADTDTQQTQAEIKALQAKLKAQERRRAAARKKLQEARAAMEALQPRLRCHMPGVCRKLVRLAVWLQVDECGVAYGALLLGVRAGR